MDNMSSTALLKSFLPLADRVWVTSLTGLNKPQLINAKHVAEMQCFQQSFTEIPFFFFFFTLILNE